MAFDVEGPILCREGLAGLVHLRSSGSRSSHSSRQFSIAGRPRGGRGCRMLGRCSARWASCTGRRIPRPRTRHDLRLGRAKAARLAIVVFRLAGQAPAGRGANWPPRLSNSSRHFLRCPGRPGGWSRGFGSGSMVKGWRYMSAGVFAGSG